MATLMNEDIKKHIPYRNSGIELLKIIAILLICISHAVQTGQQFISLEPSFDVQALMLVILRFGGVIGNTIFVVCSSWFLLDSERSRGTKVINLLFDSIFISIICLCITLMLGYKLETKEILLQFIPNLANFVWFVPFYILLYIFHPFLNAGIEKMNRKTYLSLITTLMFVFCVVGMFFTIPETCTLIYAFVVYLFVGYVKKYHMTDCDNKKKNLIVFLVGLFLFFAIISTCFLLSIKIDFFKKYPNLFIIVSPLFSVVALAQLNLFRKLNFSNAFINLCSSTSLFIYCFHENSLFRTYLRVDAYKWCMDIFGANFAIMWILASGLIMFVGGMVVSIIYKFSFHKFTSWLSVKCANLLKNFIDKLENKLYKN